MQQSALQPAQGLLLPPSLGGPKTSETKMRHATELGISHGVVIVLAAEQEGNNFVHFLCHIAIGRLARSGIHADAAPLERFVQDGIVNAADISPAAGMQDRIGLEVRIRQIRRIPKNSLVLSRENWADIGGSNRDLRDLSLDADFLPEALKKLADENPHWKGGDLQGDLNRLAIVVDKALCLGEIVFRIYDVVAVPG